ncbi:MAG: amidohydrolase family protein [Lachnospiraceae bacterium]
MLCIKNGTIYDAVNREPYKGTIIVENDKISDILLGEAADGVDLDKRLAELSKKASGEHITIIDASGMNVYPGLVDAHSHLGLDGYAVGFEGQDYNEMNDILTPQLWAIDGFYPQDETVKLAREGGVTCVGTGPGSSNVLGGMFMAVKTFGHRVDDMVVKFPVAMKCAFGENPKKCYKDKGNYSRMTTAFKLRDMLKRTLEYDKKIKNAGDDESKLPPYDAKLEALVPVVRGELPLKAHAHRVDDIYTAIRIAKEFGVGLTIEHCTDGHLIAEDLAKEGYPVAVGPSFGHATKYELRNKSFATPGILAKAGCQVSIITDAPVIPQQYLALCAGLAVKSGMDEFEALKSITINPARHLTIDERVGSIERGKDADFAISRGNIMNSESQLKYTIINGRIVYEAEETN